VKLTVFWMASTALRLSTRDNMLRAPWTVPKVACWPPLANGWTSARHWICWRGTSMMARASLSMEPWVWRPMDPWMRFEDPARSLTRPPP
jgi:hypothetical protein